MVLPPEAPFVSQRYSYFRPQFSMQLLRVPKVPFRLTDSVQCRTSSRRFCNRSSRSPSSRSDISGWDLWGSQTVRHRLASSRVSAQSGEQTSGVSVYRHLLRQRRKQSSNHHRLARQWRLALPPCKKPSFKRSHSQAHFQYETPCCL